MRKRGEVHWFLIGLIIAVIVLLWVLLGPIKMSNKILELIRGPTEDLNESVNTAWDQLTPDEQKEKTPVQKFHSLIATAREYLIKGESDKDLPLLQRAKVYVNDALLIQSDTISTAERDDAHLLLQQIEKAIAALDTDQLIDKIHTAKETGDDKKVKDLVKECLEKKQGLDRVHCSVEQFFVLYTPEELKESKNFDTLASSYLQKLISSIQKQEDKSLAYYTMALIYQDARAPQSSEQKNKAINYYRQTSDTSQDVDTIALATHGAAQLYIQLSKKQEAYQMYSTFWTKYSTKSFSPSLSQTIKDALYIFAKEGYASSLKVAITLHGSLSDDDDWSTNRHIEFSLSSTAPPSPFTLDTKKNPSTNVRFDVYSAPEYKAKLFADGEDDVQGIDEELPFYVEIAVKDIYTDKAVCQDAQVPIPVANSFTDAGYLPAQKNNVLASGYSCSTYLSLTPLDYSSTLTDNDKDEYLVVTAKLLVLTPIP